MYSLMFENFQKNYLNDESKSITCKGEDRRDKAINVYLMKKYNRKICVKERINKKNVRR